MCVTLTHLCIQRKRKRGSRGLGRSEKKKEIRTVNFANLINIKYTSNPYYQSPNECVCVLLVNDQSIKNKDLCLKQYIQECRADLTIITETWLQEDDTIWLMSTELNNDGLKMETVNRKSGKGGGLAIVYKTNITIKKLKTGATRSFEYAIWKCIIKGITTNILAIYRPPYSEKHKVTIKISWKIF